MKRRIRKNDVVVIVAGKDKGRSGRVLEVDTDRGRVVVEGANMVKKAVRPRKQNEKGGITEVEAALHISNVMVSCKSCGPTRVGYRFLDDGRKVRYAKRSAEIIDV